jgi:hypothetical protein
VERKCKISKKKYGYQAFLKPIIEYIRKIEHGFSRLINGTEELVYGKVVSSIREAEGKINWVDTKMALVSHSKK